MKLYGYWRSSSTYRVRIALNLKGVAYEQVPVHLVRNGGEQNAPGFRALSPQGRVPALALDSGAVLTQSLAIIAWLEETHPEPRLLPADPVARAQARSVALAIACDAQPMHNSSVLNALAERFGADKDAQADWVKHWVARACAALEAEAAARAAPGPFLLGDAPSLAEVCLVPHFYTARRWGLDLAPYPRLAAADAAASALPAFAAAHPDRQPDAA